MCASPAPGQSPDWVCNYPATVELFGPNQVAGQETLCDGLDNDCDGSADEDLTPDAGQRLHRQRRGRVQAPRA